MALEPNPPRALEAAGVEGSSSCDAADDGLINNAPPAGKQQQSPAEPVAGRKFKLFAFDGFPVRGFIAANGAPWVIAMDIAAPLGVSARRVRQFAQDIGGAEALILSGVDLANADRKAKPKTRTLKGTLASFQSSLKVDEKRGGARRLIALSESATLALILRSDSALKEGTFACRFRAWICGEVIPSLRRDGSYQMTRQAKELVQGMPGWGAARQEGIVARISFTDAIKAFVAAAKEAGSNNAEQYYRNFSELTRRFAKVDKKWHAGGRDALSPRDLNRLEQVEWFAADLIEKGLAKGIEYHSLFKGIKERCAVLFDFLWEVE